MEKKINVAVYNVSWKVGYDIHDDTKTKDKPVTLTYKAGITQDTGEVRTVLSCCSLLTISRIGAMYPL